MMASYLWIILVPIAIVLGYDAFHHPGKFVAALLLSWPTYMLVRLAMGFVAGVRHELREVMKEHKQRKRDNADTINREDRPNDQRPE